MFRTLVLSGGCMKGTAFIGCLKYIYENNMFKNIHNLIGSSAGSVMAFIASLGYTADEATELMKKIIEMYYSTYTADVENIINVFYSMGLDKGEFFNNMFKIILRGKLLMDDITFVEFAKCTGKNLVICGSNLTNHKTEYFCVDNSPNMSVLLALRISISLPIIFTPVIYNNCTYVDASIFNNFPIDYFEYEKNPFKDTLGICIMNDKENITPRNMLQFFSLLMDASIEKMNAKTLVNNNTIIEIHFNDNDPYNFDFNAMRFNLTNDMIEKYIDHGYKTLKSEIEKTSPDRKDK